MKSKNTQPTSNKSIAHVPSQGTTSARRGLATTPQNESVIRGPYLSILAIIEQAMSLRVLPW